MNQHDEIKVGGIYEFDLELNSQLHLDWQHTNGFPDAIPVDWRKYGDFDHIVITSDHGNEWKYAHGINSKTNHIYVAVTVYPDAIGKQIGFDPKHTPEYKTLNYHVDAGMMLHKDCQDIQSIAHKLGLTEQEYDALTSIQEKIGKYIGDTQDKIDAMDAQPVMFGEDES